MPVSASTFLKPVRLLLSSFSLGGSVKRERGPGPIVIESGQRGTNPRQFSPSPLRSGGEGRGEEAPAGPLETNPSPPALSPLRCAGRGRRPPSISSGRLDSMAVHPGHLPQKRRKLLRSAFAGKLRLAAFLIEARKRVTILLTSLGLLSGMQPAFTAPMANSIGQSGGCVCPACPKACCVTERQHGPPPAPVAAQPRTAAHPLVGVLVVGRAFADQKISPSSEAKERQLLFAGSLRLPLYRRHCAYLI